MKRRQKKKNKNRAQRSELSRFFAFFRVLCNPSFIVCVSFHFSLLLQMEFTNQYPYHELVAAFQDVEENPEDESFLSHLEDLLHVHMTLRPQEQPSLAFLQPLVFKVEIMMIFDYLLSYFVKIDL